MTIRNRVRTGAEDQPLTVSVGRIKRVRGSATLPVRGTDEPAALFTCRTPEGTAQAPSGQHTQILISLRPS